MIDPKRAQRTWTRTIATILLSALSVIGALPILAAPAAGIVSGSLYHPNLLRPSVTAFASPTCTTTAFCVSTVRTAYGFGPLVINSTMNGTGQAVSIVDACGDANIVSDLTTFDSAMGLSDPTLTIYQPQGTPCSDPTGWGLETALDVEWAHAMAPGAAINLIEAATNSNTNLFGSWNYSLAHHLGNQISNSWGGSGGCPSIARSLLTKASHQHVTILASTGDSGRWGSGAHLPGQQPADCLAILAVGGTSLTVVNVSGAYKSESAWSGGGGGYVPSTTEPAYEKTANITDSFAELAKPDVSAVANPSTGVWVYDVSSGGWVVLGGTSVSCPIWAGYLADVNDWRAANSFFGLGAVDSFLYLSIYGANGKLANYSAAFHDVTKGSNGWAAGSGWDAATGLGSFRAYALANLLANNPAA